MKKYNLLIIPPYDDRYIIAGQGTLGREAALQCKELNVVPDQIICPCGGGGLIAGLSTAVKAKFKNTEIYSVEPEHFDDTKKSLLENKIIENSMINTSICDALLANKPGDITFPINKKNLTSGISVTDEEALIAMHSAYKHFKIVLEPGGAVALAAAISNKININNKNVLVIASGGNVDKNVFESCLKTQSI